MDSSASSMFKRAMHSDPAQIGILGADTEVPHPNRAAHLLQDGEALCRWPCGESSLAHLYCINEQQSISARWATLAIFRRPVRLQHIDRVGVAGRRCLRFRAGEWVCLGCTRVCGKIPEFCCCWLVSERARERRRSMQVIVQRRILVEGPPHLAHMNPARFVRDMRKSSVFKHGRFPDTHC